MITTNGTNQVKEAQVSSSSSRAMSSCQSPSTMSIFLHRSSSRLHSHRCCCVLDQISASNLSSASSVFTSANLIAAAARGSGPLHLHGAVTSAITHLAVSALAIASGACLSTKVDFLWPRLEEQPGSIELDGVDVTGYPIFNDSKVRKAIDFAKRAHHGQLRKTGDPYLTHCIHTGRILAMLVPASGKRAVDTVVAGILHDVVDDTFESLRSIEQEFGEDVAKLVARVSRLSYINQLLRRHRRINMTQGEFGPEEADNLRVMLLGMVDDPRVVLIKLADRLHNMRTIYALPLPKARAVAQETLVVWCSLASRLGLWAMKAELEDLCFAVIQPEVFRKMRADLASMWSSSNKAGNKRRMLAKASVQFSSDEKNSSSGNEDGVHIDENLKSMKDLLEAVVPFDILTDRRKRSKYITDMGNNSEKLSLKAKVVQDAAVALASMEVCEEALERELLISTSYVPGMEVTLSSRLKSLYSIYCKMRRKDISINKVYDARALRVIIGDKNGTLHGPAVQCCYSFLDIVHRFWTPINGEFDDYIVNPKPSGYQSLHTAVLGPDSSALEVQIRTQKMHEYAEHGHAAHWLYKETVNLLPSVSNEDEPESSFLTERREEDEESVVEEDRKFEKYGGLKPGHPVLRIEGGHLLAAVIISVDKGGRELLVAVSFVLAASEAVADRRSSSQRNRWEAYAKLYKKVSNQWWCQPGHGDWSTCLERYTLCRDGMYHKQDQFGRFLPTFIQVIELTEQEESDYWRIVSAVFEGKQIDSTIQSKQPESGSGLKSSSSLDSVARGIMNNKVQLLRTMLQWEEQMRTTTPALKKKKGDEHDGGEVVIVWWPHGEIMRLKSGSTAADAACQVGLDGKFVAVNGHLVQPSTELNDGDVVEVRVRVRD